MRTTALAYGEMLLVGAGERIPCQYVCRDASFVVGQRLGDDDLLSTEEVNGTAPDSSTVTNPSVSSANPSDCAKYVSRPTEIAQH